MIGDAWESELEQRGYTAAAEIAIASAEDPHDRRAVTIFYAYAQIVRSESPADREGLFGALAEAYDTGPQEVLA